MSNFLRPEPDPSTKTKVEVERAWARARMPGPNFRLAVNKPQARGSTSLNFGKARSRLELGFFSVY